MSGRSKCNRLPLEQDARREQEPALEEAKEAQELGVSGLAPEPAMAGYRR